MRKQGTPIELAEYVAKRSRCNVQVGAVIYDDYGIFAWGFNNSGPDGMGLCAERHAISRANVKRLAGSSIAVVAFRKNRRICSIPCQKCSQELAGYGVKHVECRDRAGKIVKWEW